MRIIELGLCSLRILYPLLLPFAWTIRLSLNIFLSSMTKANPFVLTFFSIIPNILTGSIEIVYRMRVKKSKETLKTKQESERPSNRKGLFVLETYKTDKPNVYLPFALIFINSICECLFVCLFFFIELLFNNPKHIAFYEMNVVLIIISTWTTHYFLGYQIYRHHIVCIVVVILNIILIFVQLYFYQTKISIEETAKEFFVYMAMYLFIAVLDIIQKFLMERRYFSPFRILFYQGLFSTLLFMLAFLLVFPYIPCGKKMKKMIECDPLDHIGTISHGMGTLFSEMDAIAAICFVLYLIASAAYMVLLFMTIKHFTPTHRCFSETLGAFLYWILNIIKVGPMNTKEFDGYTLARCIILVITSLIYNDILIINVCEIGLDTRKKIIIRSREDVNNLIQLADTIEEESFEVDKGGEKEKKEIVD